MADYEGFEKDLLKLLRERFKNFGELYEFWKEHGQMIEEQTRIHVTFIPPETDEASEGTFCLKITNKK